MHISYNHFETNLDFMDKKYKFICDVCEFNPYTFLKHVLQSSIILQVISKNLKVLSQNLQVKNKGVIRGGIKQGPTSRSPYLLSKTFKTSFKKLVIISKNSQVHSRNLQVKTPTSTNFQSFQPQPLLFVQNFQN